jgi:RNA polymerase sigma-70 factor (ECF subfamily)
MVISPVLPSSLGALADHSRVRGVGDDEGFRAFYAATARPLWGFLRASCGDPALADDLLQESFLRLLGARLDETSESGRRAYLYRIASNLLHDHWRLRRRAPEPSPLVEADGRSAGGGEGDAAGRLDVRRALTRLAPRDRQLVWLAHVEGFSHREIAECMGLGATSVRVLLFRARRRLQQQLATPQTSSAEAAR